MKPTCPGSRGPGEGANSETAQLEGDCTFRFAQDSRSLDLLSPCKSQRPRALPEGSGLDGTLCDCPRLEASCRFTWKALGRAVPGLPLPETEAQREEPDEGVMCHEHYEDPVDRTSRDLS